jgi:hypothetical protein
MPPAAKTLFEKRVLDSQKLLLKGVFEDFIFLRAFVNWRPDKNQKNGGGR